MGKSLPNDHQALDRLSDGQLEELLRLDARSGGETLDDDTVLYILDLLQARGHEAPGAEEAWEEFEREYLPALDTENPLYEGAGEEKKPRRRWSRWLTPAAAAMLALLLAVTANGIHAAYADEQSWLEGVVYWSNRTFSLNLIPGMNPWVSLEKRAKILTEEYGLTEKLIPTYMPEGYGYDTAKANSFNANFSCYVYYKSEDSDERITLEIYETSDLQRKDYVKDVRSPIVYEAGGITHYILFNNSRMTAVWVNGDYICTLRFNNISTDEVCKVIDSIYE